jgi:chemotaxis protein methyltransferase CheR
MRKALRAPATRSDLLLAREPLSPATFQALRTLLHDHSGIALSPGKITMVQSRLAKRLRTMGLESYEAYLEILEDPKAEEWVHFINALTTNLTSFFREAHHFTRLVDLLGAEGPPPRPIRVWSAGCSTGEEPYTLAMTLLRAFGAHHPIEILATDLDTAVLGTAARGVYPLARIEGLDKDWCKYAFLRGTGEQEGLIRVRPEIRRPVRFEQVNLLDTTWSLGDAPFHAIFCRNVMIYFDKPTQRRLLQRFAQAMVPRGLLFVGHSESLLDPSLGFESLGQTIYRRREVQT